MTDGASGGHGPPPRKRPEKTALVPAARVTVMYADPPASTVITA
jgi:hypothetical protein